MSSVISKIKRDIGPRGNFFHAPFGGLRRNVAKTLGVEKLEWRGYPMVKKMKICLTVSTEYRRLTDRRTYRQTDILRQRSIVQ